MVAVLSEAPDARGQNREETSPGTLETNAEDLDDLLNDLDGTQESNSKYLTGWKGFVEIKPRFYLRDRNESKNDEQLLFISEFEFDFRFAEHLTGYFRPRIYVDGFDNELRRFEPFEGYLTYKSDRWDIRAGQLVENWGIVDTFNPIDIVNRRDFATDILDPDRLGEFGARLRLLFSGSETVGEPTLSFYTLPVFRRTRFAPSAQRFGFGTSALPFKEDKGFEPDGFDRGLYALRFQSTLNTFIFNADVQLLAARGPERTPFISTFGKSYLSPAYYGAGIWGAGFRAVPNQETLGRFPASLTLKVEIVYKNFFTFDPSPIAEPDDYVAYVFGVDRDFYNVFSNQDQITATVEFADEAGASKHDPLGRFRPFRQDMILRVFWQANDFARKSLEVRSIFDFDSQEFIFESTFETQLRAINEDLKLLIQFQYFDAPDTRESFFSLFTDNTSLAVGVRWDF